MGNGHLTLGNWPYTSDRTIDIRTIDIRHRKLMSEKKQIIF